MVNPELKKTLLSTLPLRYLDMHELDMLLNYCTIVNFSMGESLCQQGKKSDGMYIIVRGKAIITAKTLGKDSIHLAALEQGNFVGEVSLIEKGPCTASVIADNQLECLFISTTYFDMMSTFFPETRYKISKAITEEVCNRLQAIHQQVTSLMAKTSMITNSLINEVLKSFTKLESTDFASSCLDKKQLHHNGFFKKLTEDEFNELLSYFTLLKSPDNCVLIKEGEKNTPYYMILCGAVQLTISQNKKAAKLAVLASMDFFGNISYIHDSHSIITYTTCERAILLRITDKELSHLKEKNIQLWYKLFDLICLSFISLQRAADKLLIRLNSELYNR